MGNLITNQNISQWHQKRRQQETQIRELRSSRLNAQYATLSHLTELDQCSRVLLEQSLEPKKVSPIQQHSKERVENGTIKLSINGSNHQLITHQVTQWLMQVCQTLKIEVTLSPISRKLPSES